MVSLNHQRQRQVYAIPSNRISRTGSALPSNRIPSMWTQTVVFLIFKGEFHV